jgi:hypothetical protein
VRRRDKIPITVGVVLTLLVAAPIALPYGLERAIDRGLMAMEGYQGSVSDVDLALWKPVGQRILRTCIHSMSTQCA